MGLGWLNPGIFYRCCQCTSIVDDEDFAVDPSWDTLTGLDTSGGELIVTADDSFGVNQIVLDSSVVIRYLCVEADITWDSNTEFAVIFACVATSDGATDPNLNNVGFCLGASSYSDKYCEGENTSPAAPLGFGMPTCADSGTARFKILMKIYRVGQDCGQSGTNGAIAKYYVDGDYVGTRGQTGLTWSNYRIRAGVRASASVDGQSYYSACSWDNMVVSYS